MQRLIVLGGGESGVGTAVLGKKKGYEVFLSDKNLIPHKYKEVLLHNKIEFEENQHTESLILNADMVVKSPGIPEKVLLVQKLVEKKIPVISEIEFAAQYTDAKIIGITGSNGKTTTAMLLYHLLNKAGLDVNLAGNIGDSFAGQIAKSQSANYVLELSSFQLDGIQKFSPHISMITSITPDHLNRYDYDFDKYVASKFRITMNQTKNDFFIYDADDKAIDEGLKIYKARAKLVPFSLEKELEYGAFLQKGNIITRMNSKEFKMNTTRLTLLGKHNIKNAMAATLASQLLELRSESIKESLSNFEGVEHRLENVLKINGVEFINDSKATNINATYYALECMNRPTIWIVGGEDKGNDYTNLLPLVREKVKAIVCLGLDNEKIKKSFSNCIEMIVETFGADEAVKVAHKLSQKGDVVLLSPACSSFDLFEGYKERGRQFKQAVRRL